MKNIYKIDFWPTERAYAHYERSLLEFTNKAVLYPIEKAREETRRIYGSCTLYVLAATEETAIIRIERKCNIDRLRWIEINEVCSGCAF